MDRLQLLRKYQDLDRDGQPLARPRTNREFAALIGVHESYLSKCYDRAMPVGMKALRGLRHAIPASAQEVEALIFGEWERPVVLASAEKAAVAV